MKTVFCPYCGYKARFSPTSSHLYRGQDYGPVYECPKNCDAYVGAHRDTLEPMGRLANKPLRALKMATHQVFHPLWRDLAEAYPDMNIIPKRVLAIARGRAYQWLALQMGLTEQECHIAAFDEHQCRQCMEIIERLKPTAATIRQWAKDRAAA